MAGAVNHLVLPRSDLINTRQSGMLTFWHWRCRHVCLLPRRLRELRIRGMSESKHAESLLSRDAFSCCGTRRPGIECAIHSSFDRRRGFLDSGRRLCEWNRIDHHCIGVRSIVILALSPKLGRIYCAVPAETSVGRPVETKTAPRHSDRKLVRVSLEQG